MHWIMWVFWGFFATLLTVVNLVGVLTKQQNSSYDIEKSLNQNTAVSGALREVGRIDQHVGPF